jgi:phosphoribosyl 1,2-cyclic phosphodiesterase
MALFTASIASGSNGNCYYIGNEEEAVLIDAGISCRETERRMKRLGLAIAKVKAIFISHEHSDHIRGLHSLVKKYQLPVYITQPALQYGRLYLENQAVRSFRAYEPVIIGGLAVTAFPKLHDASDPYSFVIGCKGLTVGVFTDIGLPCHHVIKHFGQCHAAFLETNYDEEMLEKGNYPVYLKRRIRDGKGHLSNRQALDLFKKHRPPFMSHLFLSHLSKNNNCPRLVQDLFNQHAGSTKIILASRSEETALYCIENTGSSASTLHYTPVSDVQLELSFL